eukprot:COSAG02_NODE_3237_length_7121_cov_16.614782_4_plen_200_part_00
MPTQPTCKVVKREGERGARIDPKGCKVRTTKDAQGNKRQYNKRGEEKITLKTTGNEMRLVVAGARQHSTVRNWGNRTMRQRAEWRDRHKMIYDTGAQVTSMSREMCDRLRIDWRRTTNYTMQSVQIIEATCTVQPVVELLQVDGVGGHRRIGYFRFVLSQIFFDIHHYFYIHLKRLLSLSFCYAMTCRWSKTPSQTFSD